jgi:RNA polymerase sigma-70 factor (ECF subfamily)
VSAADVDAERRRRFEDVVAGVYEPVQRYLRRRTDPATADDVLGDVLLVLWRRLDDVPVDLPLSYAYGVEQRHRAWLRLERTGHPRPRAGVRRRLRELIRPPTASAPGRHRGDWRTSPSSLLLEAPCPRRPR